MLQPPLESATGNTKGGGGYHAATHPNRQGRNTQQKPRRHTQHPHQGGWVSVCGAFARLSALAHENASEAHTANLMATVSATCET